MRTILVVGGGYAGFYTAWKLERKLRRGEARVVVIDPRPYMTYQPFLPEVLAGSVEARHAAVSQRRHLKSKIISGTVVQVNHGSRTVTVRPAEGPEYELGYDILVVTAGAVTRKFAIPGVVEQAIGLKHVEEAVAIRDQLLTAFDRASTLPPGPRRRRLLTVTFVGGGFSGVEGFGELLSLATALVKKYPELDPAEVSFHLVEARDRILPEVTEKQGRWVVRSLEKRGAHVHLGAQMRSAKDGHVVLSTGVEFDSDLIVWTAGNAANPMVHNRTDLPVDARGLLVVRADLRVGTSDAPIPDAWGAGDDAAVPDLATGNGTATVPNAQHAVRQGKLLARNILADLRGGKIREYKHHSLGTVATLGLGRGIFEWKGIVVKGFPAWLMHRGYHVLAVPSWERKFRVLAIWLTAAVFGRDIVSLASVQHPRQAFVTGGDPAALTIAPEPVTDDTEPLPPAAPAPAVPAAPAPAVPAAPAPAVPAAPAPAAPAPAVPAAPALVPTAPVPAASTPATPTPVPAASVPVPAASGSASAPGSGPAAASALGGMAEINGGSETGAGPASLTAGHVRSA